MIGSLKNWMKKRDVASWRTAVAAVRREYTGEPLTEEYAGDDPFILFEKWYADAAEQSLFDANSFVLSTAADGKPRSRVVLLKGFDETGFVFYTNYDSDKGREIEVNPHVCVNFNWPESFRQLRIEGKAERISDEESDAYFNSRPFESNLSAVVSPQSRTVNSREELELAQSRLREEHDKGGEPLKRPSNWGGYRIVPDTYEFWQGRTGRLHDRITFEKSSDGKGWRKSRLAP